MLLLFLLLFHFHSCKSCLRALSCVHARVPFFFPSLLINVFLLAFDFPSRSTPPILLTPMSQKMGLT